MTTTSKDAVKVVTDIRDRYIRENCQTFNDGHWVGTAKQQEYVSELDDIIAALQRAAAVLVATKPEGNVYSRAECIFNYCPDPEGCTTACASPRQNG